MTSNPRVLVVEDSPTQAMGIRLMLQEYGYEVVLAENGREALQLLDNDRPAVIVTDLEMPEMDGLELVQNVKDKYPDLPVVLMTLHGSEEIAVRALQCGAASYVPKRLLQDEIHQTLQVLLSISNQERQSDALLGHLVSTESCYRLPNDHSLIAGLISHFQQQLRELQLFGLNEQLRVATALSEALANAVEHGNLEVSSEHRRDDLSAYFQLVETRRAEAPYRDRRIEVTAKYSQTEAVYVIRDEGQGFDPSSLPDPTLAENLDRLSGRGLMLIRAFMDHVEHNATGTEITMVKRRSSKRE